MKKRAGIIAAAFLGVFLVSGIAFAWQGRMAGMGDPYGLVEDESDLLVNPAGMADGEGIHYYGHYKFTFGDVIDWKFNTVVPQIGNLTVLRSASGVEVHNETLLGAGFPVGDGRMGLFFSYSGNRNSYDGTTFYTPDIFGTTFDMKSEFDNFALRLLYGRTLSNGVKVGGEIRVAHQREENRYSDIFTAGGVIRFSSSNSFLGNLLPFLSPYDSNYWEVLAKVGLEGRVGPATVGWALRGGSIVSGDDDLSGSTQLMTLTPAAYRMPGGVDGWKIGTDLWVRIPYSETVTLPFMLQLDYSEKSRNGTGTTSRYQVGIVEPPFFFDPLIFDWFPGSVVSYSGGEQIFQIVVGGGVDVILSKNSSVAAGLYYNYLNVKNDLTVRIDESPTFISSFDYGAMPNLTEHLLRLKFAVESRVHPEWTVRGGLDLFGGFAQEDYSSNLNIYSGIPLSMRASLDGTHWGITAYFGATTTVRGATVEPFVMAGYQELSVSDGNTRYIVGSNPSEQMALDKDRKQAVIGAGISIKF